MMTSVNYYTGCLGSDVRCEGITAAGEQCKCRAVMEVNAIPYCKQHGEKEIDRAEAFKQGMAVGKALAAIDSARRVEKGRGGRGG